MCGLVAMITKNRNGFNNANMDMFDVLLFVDQMRGQDSTGVFMVNNIGNVQIAKEAVNSSDFLTRPDYRNLRTDAIRNGWAMVGHNRKATRGNIVDKNAHPFWVEDKLVLVHNGSYFGDHKHLKDTEVDSEAIAQVLAEGGDEVAKSLQSINAAYALIWYEVEKKRLSFIRNNQRPLFWAETHDAYYFCSDPDFMEFAAKRTNTKFLDAGPYSFDVNSLDRWVLNQDRSTSLTTEDIDTNYRAPAHRPTQSAANFSSPACNVSWPGSLSHLVDGDEEEDPPTKTQLALIQEEIEAAEAENASRREAVAAVLKAQGKEKTLQVETKAVVSPTPTTPDWTKAHTFREWKACKELYQTGTRVRVECKDYLNDAGGPGMIYLTGKTMDANGLYVIFPVAKELFEAITAPDSPSTAARKCEFMVDIDVCGWRPSPDHQKGQELDDVTGVITLTAKKAKMYSDGVNSVQ